jgi:hypothetical protein
LDRLLQRFPFGLVVPIAIAGTIVAFAAGSSSVAGALTVGRPLRWIALVVLLVAAAGWAISRRNEASLRLSVLAAAAAFLAVALESTLWSVDSRLTFEKAASLVLLLVVAAALAIATAGRRWALQRVLLGVVGGAAAVAAVGLLLLAVDHGAAVEAATLDLPARYRGFGQNPNTVSLLLALCLPIAVWFALRAGSRREAALALAGAVFFDGSIVASASRAALIAGFAGVFVVVALASGSIRFRLVCAGVTVVVLVVSVVIALAPKSKGEATATTPTAPAASAGHKPKPKPRYVNVDTVFPLSFDIGEPLPGQLNPTHRTLLGLSGRGEAWRGALDEADARPALGYGFGTEGRVFVDRYVNFAADLPESSYVGLYLQLGAIGLLAFLALVAALALSAVRGMALGDAAVVLAVLVVALLIAVTQSYVYSVGNIGTATAWICAFLGAGLTVRRAAT